MQRSDRSETRCANVLATVNIISRNSDQLSIGCIIAHTECLNSVRCLPNTVPTASSFYLHQCRSTDFSAFPLIRTIISCSHRRSIASVTVAPVEVWRSDARIVLDGFAVGLCGAALPTIQADRLISSNEIASTGAPVMLSSAEITSWWWR